jgi:hypothetical protein
MYRTLGLLVCLLGVPAVVSAGQAAPTPPDTIARGADGRTTVRAVRLTAPLQLDGRLDESIYRDVAPITGLYQIEPRHGEQATDRTEAWIFFDDDNVYVSTRAWESQRSPANEMRRDVGGIAQNEHIGWTFDTFHDKRNALMWIISPIGGRMDGQITDERLYNADFNPVYDVKTGRFDGGWTIETAIPFKSLRYKPGREQTWGFNMRRTIGWKNEIDFLTLVPQIMAPRGLNQQSQAATLVGLEAPDRSLSLELKPYAIADLTTDRLARPAISNDPGADAGIDVKYGITQNVTADFTYNTDFAQVEADEQQVNLTRFSLFFPEKREFFLENQGTFSFGASSTGSASSNAGDMPTVFYSRRIGLSAGRSVPIQAGGRVTGRLGRYSLGLLNMQSEEEEALGARSTNFSVARLKRDILRRSQIGVIATHRSVRETQSGSNDAFGADLALSFFELLNINGYWAKTRTTGLADRDTSYRGQLDYGGDRYGVQLEHLLIGDNFNPEIGFVRRDDMRKSYALLRFSPRPAKSRLVRKYSWTGTASYIENTAGHLETRDLDGEFAIEFHNGDRFYAAGSGTYEFLPVPFRIAPQVILPVGGYDYASVKVGYRLGQQRPQNADLSVEHGSFYSGNRTVFSATQGRVEMSPQFSLQPSVSVNRIALEEGNFTTTLVGSRVTYTMTPLMFVSALLQYNSASNSLAANVRLRWEYHPGSELFVVYNDQRNTLTSGIPDLQNRAFIVKINRLIRF